MEKHEIKELVTVVANATVKALAANSVVKSVDYKGVKIQIEKTASGWEYTVFENGRAQDSAGGYPSEQAALADAKRFAD